MTQTLQWLDMGSSSFSFYVLADVLSGYYLVGDHFWGHLLLKTKFFPVMIVVFMFLIYTISLFSLVYCSCRSLWKTIVSVFWIISFRSCIFSSLSRLNLFSSSTISACIPFILFSSIRGRSISVSTFSFMCLMACQSSLVQETGVQGVQAHPQKFWFCENPGKICGNMGKVCENLCKITEIWANSKNTSKNGAQLVWLKKWRPTCFEKTAPKSHEDSFLVIWSTVFMRKYSYKKWPKTFSSKFGKIRPKILRTLKKLPAPTPMQELVLQLKFFFSMQTLCLNFSRCG